MGNKSDKCPSCKYRIDPGGWAACDGCIHDEGLKDRYEPMTNADRIRNMTDEELAKMIMGAPYICGKIKLCGVMSGCEECCLVWLRSPVEESEK